jgi:hypothetical protein
MWRLIAIVGLFTACTEASPPVPASSSHVTVHEIAENRPPRLDLLIVVDNTTAMAPYQARMAMLPKLIETTVQATALGRLDVRIAVVTNDGLLRRTASVADPFIAFQTDFDLVTTTNYQGTLEDTLGALMKVDATNDGPSQPFAAQRRALENQLDGFLREGASLGVLTISAVDDASPLLVSEYVTWLKSLEPDPSRVYLTGIYAKPSTRLDELYGSFPDHSLTISIDDSDYRPAIEAFEQVIKTNLLGLCWTASDVDLDVAGSQYDCTFTAEIHGVERALPPCASAGDQFCWQLVVSDHQGCAPNPQPLRPNIPPFEFSWFNPTIRAQCVVLD